MKKINLSLQISILQPKHKTAHPPKQVIDRKIEAAHGRLITFEHNF